MIPCKHCGTRRNHETWCPRPLYPPIGATRVELAGGLIVHIPVKPEDAA